MNKLLLQGLKLVIAKPINKRSNGYVKQGKLVTGTVIEINGIYKISIDLDKTGTTSPLILDFTPESFNLVGRQRVFTRTKDKNGRTTCIIRDKFAAKTFPGLEEQYTPFAPRWTIKGYIVKKGIQKFFDFKDLIGIGEYKVNEIY